MVRVGHQLRMGPRVHHGLALHYATSTGSEGSLMDLMKKIVEMTPDYTGQDSFVPPPSWTGADRRIVQQVKDLLEQSIPCDTKGTTAPVIHVGIHNH